MSSFFDATLSSPTPQRDLIEPVHGQRVYRAILSSLLAQAAAWTGCSANDSAGETDDAPPAAQPALQDGNATNVMDAGRPISARDAGRACDFSDGIIDIDQLRFALPFECPALCEGTELPLTGRDTGAGPCALHLPFTCDGRSSSPTSSDPRCEPIFCRPNTLVAAWEGVLRTWQTPGAVREALGPIDSTDDALLYLAAFGYSVCADRTAAEPADGDGYLVYGTKQDIPEVLTKREIEHAYRIGRDGSLRLLGERIRTTPLTAIGRLPAGVVLSTGDARVTRSFGDYLARCAALEAASVPAFAQLAEELTAYGAPADLVAAARAAQQDEVKHACVIGALAQRHGGVICAPRVEAVPGRTLADIARENAVEGCVRETYGALVAAHQGAYATDDPLRRAMAQIAADEMRHAALSYAVHAWLLPQLDDVGRALVHAAQRQAIHALRDAAAEDELDDDLADAAGLPSAELAQHMLDHLVETLWQPALSDVC